VNRLGRVFETREHAATGTGTLRVIRDPQGESTIRIEAVRVSRVLVDRQGVKYRYVYWQEAPAVAKA
jgi:hypothetical protein